MPQAYVADCSSAAKRAQNLGIFQGLSVGCAFVLAFPIGGKLGAKLGPRVPLRIAAVLQLLAALIITFLMPESRPARVRQSQSLYLGEASPLAALARLFGRARLLRDMATAYALVSLARSSLDAQFINYANLRFGWSQQQAGPVMVVVGLMLAVAPRVLVPLLGLERAMLSGMLVFALGLGGAGLAPSPTGFVAWIMVVSVGCMCIPALQAVVTSLADPAERGALLGALGAVNELTAAVGSTLYAAVLAAFTSDRPPLPLPGMHFFLGAALLVVAWAISARTFAVHPSAATRAVGAGIDSTETV